MESASGGNTKSYSQLQKMMKDMDEFARQVENERDLMIEQHFKANHFEQMDLL